MPGLLRYLLPSAHARQPAGENVVHVRVNKCFQVLDDVERSEAAFHEVLAPVMRSRPRARAVIVRQVWANSCHEIDTLLRHSRPPNGGAMPSTHVRGKRRSFSMRERKFRRLGETCVRVSDEPAGRELFHRPREVGGREENTKRQD